MKAGFRMESAWLDADLLGAVNPAVVQVGLHRAVRGWQSPPRHAVQTDFDIWYVADGCGAASVEGAWHEFEAGDVITMPPGMVYTGERGSQTDPFTVYFAHLLPFGCPDAEKDATIALHWPLRMSVRHRTGVLPVFEALLESWVLSGGRQSLQARGLALQLLGILLEELSGEAHPPLQMHRRVLAARQLIAENLAHPLSVREIAEHAGLSVSHLSALFNEHLGMPPNEYMLQVRLREARVLLARGLSVKEAAHATGFSSQQYFSRLFRRRMGICPTAFARGFARDAAG